MIFLQKFLSNFTEVEKNSELVKIVSQIGVNIESSIISDFTAIALNSTELIYFSEARLRSWLAFFFQEVRNYISSKGVAYLQIESATSSVSLPEGKILQTQNGIDFTQTNTLFLNEGESSVVVLRQGRSVETSGIYSEHIILTSENIDISDLTVFIDKQKISKVKNLGGGNLASNSILPHNGFWAFFENNQLIIKIYKGSSTPDPEGQNYSVIYWTCDGLGGNAPVNSITGYRDVLYDSLGEEVTYSITNPAIIDGASSPKKLDLVNLLRRTFYVQTSVSSVPEYKRWFLTQPEVGDCNVQSDYTKWLDTGVSEVTGIVDVYIANTEGNALTSNQLTTLKTNLEEVKDIALVQFKDFQEVFHYFDFIFYSSSNDSNLEDSMRAVFQNFYDVTYNKEKGLSNFTPLNLDLVMEEIPKIYSAKGVTIHNFYYKEILNSEETSQLIFPTFEESTPGGRYEVWEGDSKIASFTEYKVKNEGEIYDNSTKLKVGFYDSLSGDITINYFLSAGSLLKCFIKMAVPKIATMGSQNAIRKLKGVSFERTS